MPRVISPYTRPALPHRVLLYGRDEPPRADRPLRAGPLSLVLRGGELLDLRLGDVPLLARIGVAVYDHEWARVPGVRLDLSVQAEDESFAVTYVSRHARDEVDFEWHATIRGEAYGAITFVMDGHACATFWRQRLGFFLLHPTATCAGRPFVAGGAGGVNVVGQFPAAICPEATIPGLREMRALDYEVGGGLRFECRFEGDLFETEDARNGLLPAFRTFCTPLARTAPVRVDQGTRIRQTVTLRARGTPLAPAVAAPQQPIALTVDTTRQKPLPPLGLRMPPHGLTLTQRERERLRVVRPAHIRVDLTLLSEGWRQRLTTAAQDARLLGAGLEIALLLDDVDEALPPLLELVRESHAAVHRWIVLAEGETTTSARTAQRAACLRVLGAPVGGGTDRGLLELSHDRPAVDELEFVALPLRPQLADADDETLLEALAVLPEALACARRVAQGRPLHVSPLMLRAPHAQGWLAATRATPPSELPPEVDPRQMSLLGAAWTVGCLAALAEAGVASVTAFDTTGWLGLLETDKGSARPALFHSIPGAAFPVYHVLADVAEHAGGVVLAVENAAPRDVAALALSSERGSSVLVANLRPEPRRVALAGLGRHCTLRLLEAVNAQRAMTEPGPFRSAQLPLIEADGPLLLELPPFAVARLSPRVLTED